MLDYKKYVRSLMANRSLSMPQKLGYIKMHVNSSEYKEALKLYPIFGSYLKQRLTFEKPEDISQREAFFYTDDFKREFRWTTLVIEEHFDLLNRFIKSKRDFEASIVATDYDTAKVILQNNEAEFGVTLWSIESNLLIEELSIGTQANWNKLSYYLSIIKNPFYEFVINTSSKRTETNLSYEAFLNQFQNDLDNTHANSLVTDFFVFKNIPIASYDFGSKSLSSVLYISSLFGVIDQYLILVDVIAYHALDPEFHSGLFVSFLRKANDAITNDLVIKNLYRIIGSNNHIGVENAYEIVHCLNLYYSGQFEKALLAAQVGIKNHSLEFEFYEVYCKSLVNLGQPPNLEFSSFQNSIINDLFEVFNFRETFDACSKRLVKQAILLSNFSFGRQLYLIISEIESHKSRHNKVGFIYASYSSTKILEQYQKAPALVNKFQVVLNNIAYKVALFKSGVDATIEQHSFSSPLQLIMIYALHHFNKGSYNAVIKLLCEGKELDDKPYYLERKLCLLFESYINIQNYDEALKIFVDVIFSESLVSKKINYHQLHTALKAPVLREKIHNIALPILFSLVVNEYDLFEVFDEFMEKEGYLNISEIDVDDMIGRYSLDLFTYFLEKVVTIDTLKYSTDYNSVSDVEEARIDVLRILIRINNKDKLTYEDEINDIYRMNAVRKVLKEVDEGRLYIDVNGLKNFQIKNFNEQYKRFKEIESISSSQNLIGFNASMVRTWDPNIITDEKNPTYNSANYLAFKNIYLELRDNFLFSKEYGLDSCLSTRIRHGALKNHIRSVFEKLDLVTSKSPSGYLENHVWASYFANYPEINIRVQQRLKKFSAEIDNYTSFIVDKIIQIKTEKITDRPDALFQYMTHDELLFSFYTANMSRFDSIEITVEILLTDLVNYTLINIGEDVVNAFTKEKISETFQEIIEKLLADLRGESLPYGCDLISHVMKSTTEIQNELEYLSEWFYLNTTSPSTLLSMETILNASLNLTNRINPLFNLSPTIEIKQDYAGYSSLIFVFNILLNNVITHSNLGNDEIELKIEVDVSDDQKYAFIKFVNNLHPDFDYSSNLQKLEDVKSNWNNHQNIDRSNKEGESGYVKIKRMLIYETLTKTDRFEYELENDSISITLFFPYNKPKSNE